MKRRAGAGLLRISVSRPVRGAWIETSIAFHRSSMTPVAPRAGRVD